VENSDVADRSNEIRANDRAAAAATMATMMLQY